MLLVSYTLFLKKLCRRRSLVERRSFLTSGFVTFLLEATQQVDGLFSNVPSSADSHNLGSKQVWVMQHPNVRTYFFTITLNVAEHQRVTALLILCKGEGITFNATKSAVRKAPFLPLYCLCKASTLEKCLIISINLTTSKLHLLMDIPRYMHF